MRMASGLCAARAWWTPAWWCLPSRKLWASRSRGASRWASGCAPLLLGLENFEQVVEAEAEVAAGGAEAASAEAGLAAVRAQVSLKAGAMAMHMGAYATAEPALEQARALALATGAAEVARKALPNQGRIATDQGDLERAAAL